MQRDFGPYRDEIRDGLTQDRFYRCFKPLTDFEEQEARWIIPGWMPAEQITLLASDGGVGKTGLWVNILAALSRGTPTLLDAPGASRPPMTAAFLTTEDSVSKKLKRRLRLAGADESRILTMDLSADREGLFRDFKFGSGALERFIRHFRPDVCVFDPVQGFVPPEVNMASRNAMRDCTAPLIALGEEVGTSFLLVCHTNKRKGAAGRDRIADSADLWDVARSVWMAGQTPDPAVRYVSNEKNNYAELQETRLFRIDGEGLLRFAGASPKRDREYMQAWAETAARPGRTACRSWVLTRLPPDGSELALKTLYDEAAAAGFSESTMHRTMAELYREKLAANRQAGNNRDRRWFVRLLPIDLAG